MSKIQKDSKLKHYHIFLLGCLLGSVMVINSIYVNKNRDLIKQNQEKEVLFINLIKKRILSENPKTYSEEVCSRGSESLRKYYETGDLSEIDLEDGEIKCEDKDKGYMQALIRIVRKIVGDDEGEDSAQNHLRNLASFDKEDIIEYGKRILPMVVFFVFGILSIFGWIVCCFCTCCNCCCCCCCKKSQNKLRCFIFTYAFYALDVVVCIYGLAQSNKIFEGLSNTECSTLKFFDQVLYGETKQTLPRWGGITKINQILYDLESTIDSIKTTDYAELNNKFNQIPGLQSAFVTKMHDAAGEFYDHTSNEYKAPYLMNIPSTTTEYPLSGKFIYDTVYNFGTIDSINDPTKSSYLSKWNFEYTTITNEADGYLDIAKNSFDDILVNNIVEVKKALSDGAQKLDEITKPFKDANEQIGEILSDMSETIDKNGKRGVKIVFSVLMVMNVALAALLLLICLFSGKCCTSCCFCRCLFKCCTHILWNVLALMMILSFIVGSLVSLVGRLGGDAMSLVSFIMSKENFNNDENALLLNELGGAKKYLERCIQGNGDIAQELGLGNSLNSFENINTVENDILSIKNIFSQHIINSATYKLIINQLSGQKDHIIDIEMIPLDGSSLIKYSNLERERDNLSPSSTDIPKYNKLLTDINNIVRYAINVINILKSGYDEYLGKYDEIFDTYLVSIGKITKLVRKFSGSDGNQSAFAFLNGKFIGTNLKIILKYLKHSLGGDFFTVGICLVAVGFSLIISISSTILLIVIINISLKENMDAEKTLNNPNSAISGISQYQMNVASATPKLN